MKASIKEQHKKIMHLLCDLITDKSVTKMSKKDIAIKEQAADALLLLNDFNRWKITLK